MDYLVELPDSRAGRKVYQYINSEGKNCRIVSKSQHLLDLKAQGKLVTLNVEEISFSSKRKRSVSVDQTVATVPGDVVFSEGMERVQNNSPAVQSVKTIIGNAIGSSEAQTDKKAAVPRDIIHDTRFCL